MCGISGIFAQQTLSPSQHVAIKHMLEVQQHRGPDHQAHTQVGEHILLGHNRLSIVDIHAHANQPMVSEDDRYHMVFNGEIYNYVELRKQLEPHYTFKTSSDSEVLLYAFAHWGD